MGFESFIQVGLDSLFQASILALATLGIVLIFKTSFTTNFAQGSIAVLSSYVMYEVSTKLYGSTTGNNLIPVWMMVISILIATLFAFVVGYGIDTFIIRKAKSVTSAGKQMITMGLVLVIAAIIDLVFGVLAKSNSKISQTVLVLSSQENLKISIPVHNLVGIITASIVILGLFIALKYTKWGLGVRATASNELVSSMLGINTRIITAISWAAAGALGALAAAFYTPIAANLNSMMMTTIQINAFLALILGGAATFYGPVVAAVLITFATGYISYFESSWYSVIVYSLILVVILLKPVGLFGKKINKKV